MARAEVRAVQFAAFARPPAAPSATFLEKFIRNQARTVVPVVADGAADITTAVVTTATAGVTTPLKTDSAN
jgi:hypothetical protein